MSVEEREENLNNLRNIPIPVAPMKPKNLFKALFVSLFTFGFILLLDRNIFFNTNNNIFIGFLIAFIMYIGVKIYEYFKFLKYILSNVNYKTNITFGFANKLLVYVGTEVLQSVDTDKIVLRRPRYIEMFYYYGFATILEGYRDNKLVALIPLYGVKEYNGSVFKPNLSRVEEDIVIID